MAEEKAIGMKILSTSGNTYTFEFGMVGNDQKQKRTVTTNRVKVPNPYYNQIHN
jgi:hypothetical protein